MFGKVGLHISHALLPSLRIFHSTIEDLLSLNPIPLMFMFCSDSPAILPSDCINMLILTAPVLVLYYLIDFALFIKRHISTYEGSMACSKSFITLMCVFCVFMD